MSEAATSMPRRAARAWARASAPFVVAIPIAFAAVTVMDEAHAERPVVRTAARPTAAQQPGYGQRSDVRNYIDALVASGRFERSFLTAVFADARFSATSARLMSPSGPGGVRRDWNVYRARFVEPVRLAAGLRFWDEQATWLARAEADFGVPPEIIVGILGCETVYGRNTGNLRVVDTLSTLSFDYPNRARDRSAFFREQLGDVLALGRDGLVDLGSLRGSYAGAIGMPQFMPGSIQSDAIDYDGDGRIDLLGSPADIIGSVANFLAQRGWVRNLPARIELAASPGNDALRAAGIDRMVDAGSEPTFAFTNFADVGFVALSLPPDAPLALIDLPSGVDARGTPVTAYVAGTQNFHVVTRYNRSYFYALSVIELGETIKALRDARAALESANSAVR